MKKTLLDEIALSVLQIELTCDRPNKVHWRSEVELAKYCYSVASEMVKQGKLYNADIHTVEEEGEWDSWSKAIVTSLLSVENSIPVWVEWVAQDDNGDVWLFQKEPHYSKSDGEWLSGREGGKYFMLGNINLRLESRDSLHKIGDLL